tara:strand:- start:58 stop:432 length:375 start_codon:yes stop_codon:yes gene_type:complete
MIKKIIDKLFKKTEVEVVVDDDVDVYAQDDLEDDYTGVPAPVVAPHDDWFDDPPKTEMQMEYEHINDDPHDGWWLRPEHEESSKEPDNIHELMYNIATNHGKTTVQLNPPGGSENFLGGSENHF